MGEKDSSSARWREQDSTVFAQLGRYAVPGREAQIDAICRLVPEPADDSLFEVVDLCCGEGLLSEALLERLPRAKVRGLDGSPAMLARAERRCARFGARFEAARIELAERDWRRVDEPLRALVSSLAIHHLDDAGKRALYADIFEILAPGGALIVADLVAPASDQALALAADGWDDAVRERARSLDGDERAFEHFVAERWNLYRHPDPEVDKPSRLYHQLRWLDDAGYRDIDVVWMRAGHAVFTGRRPA